MSSPTDYSPIQAIGFLRSCIRGGELLSAQDDADIDRVIAALRSERGKTTSEWKQYRLKGTLQARPYMPGETFEPPVYISEANRQTGSPKVGDMIIRDPDDPSKQRLIIAACFADICEPVPMMTDEKRSGTHPSDHPGWRPHGDVSGSETA